jgi:hypothetical protein
MGYIQNRLIAGRRARHLVALSTLFNGEIKPAMIKDKPYSVSYGHACQAKRNEDFVVAKTSCQRLPGDLASSTYDAFAVSSMPSQTKP